MWGSLLGRMPEFLVIFCTFLAFFVPFCVYKVNKRLHKYGDPPWKKSDEDTNVVKSKKK